MIVEGQGDVDAFPHLVGKIGAWIGAGLFIKNPIRAGGWGRVCKEGGLEKLVALAVSREGCNRVVIAVDLDDGCPVVEQNKISQRIAKLQETYGIIIELCFCLREFEAWYLRCIDLLADLLEDSSTDLENVINSAANVRDAKGTLRRLLKDGYSVSSDQGQLMSRIDPAILFFRDRSFRRLVKAISGLDYDLLEAA